jgi:hypothetical protein
MGEGTEKVTIQTNRLPLKRSIKSRMETMKRATILVVREAQSEIDLIQVAKEIVTGVGLTEYNPELVPGAARAGEEV